MATVYLLDRHQARTLKGFHEIGSLGLPVQATEEQLEHWKSVLTEYEIVQKEMRRASWLADIAYHRNNSSNGDKNDDWHAHRADRLQEELDEAIAKGEV